MPDHGSVSAGRTVICSRRSRGIPAPPRLQTPANWPRPGCTDQLFSDCKTITHERRVRIRWRATRSDRCLTISRPTVGARLRTPRSTDAGDAVASKSLRCGPGRPYCRLRSLQPVGARGYRLPASSRSRRQSAHLQCGCPAASVPLPCSVRAGLGMICHCKWAARWESCERRARVREDNRSLRAVGVHLIFAHKSSCLLTHQKTR